MILLFKKKSIALRTIVLCLVLVCMAGCSNTKNNESQNESSTISNNSTDSATSSAVSSATASLSSTDAEAVSSQNDSSEAQSQVSSPKTPIETVKELAKQGKIVDCEFAVKSTNTADVVKKWGDADKSEYVTSAKGTYDTYSKHNVVFGSNKGAQIFEVRSYDKQLSKITLSTVKKEYGTPGYDYKSKTEEVIGYKVTQDFKILFVFALPTKSNSNPQLDHYSIFYPAGTVNSMAGDPGREW